MHKSELHNVHTFSSPAELAEFSLKQGYLNHYGNDSWVANLSGYETANFALSGNDKGVEEATKIMEKFSLDISSSVWVDVPSVAGCYPCVPEALMGEPECMREPMEIPSDTAPLQIVVDLACTQTITAEQMQNRGVAILALVMALTATRPVSLKFISCGFSGIKTRRDNYCIAAVDIPTTPLDLATSGYLLTNVGFVRQMMYGYKYTYMGFNGKYQKFHDLDKHDVSSPQYVEKMRECLEIEGEFLFIPQARASNTLVIRDPIKWLQDQLAQYQHHI